MPDGLDEAQHVRLGGRGAHPLVRRGVLLLLAVLVVAALFDRFGQRPTTSKAAAPFATLEVQSPHTLRGGLIFQTRLTVHARTTIRHPTLVLQHGWFESMSVNSIVPDPVQQSTVDGDVRLVYPTLLAGHSATTWIYFQVNPTNIARRSENVVLEGGRGQRIVVHRSVVVLP